MPVRRKGGEEVNYFNKNKRLYAFLAAFLVTAVLLLSGLFIVTHAEHDCTGEDCLVCAEIEACVCTIQLLSKAVGTGAYLVISKILSLCQTGLFLCPVSLVSLKIRLDN